MVDLPTVPNNIVTSTAPRSSLTGADIAAPYNELAGNLAKGADLANEVATGLAKKAALTSVTRDEQGDIQVAPTPFLVGPAAEEYQKVAHQSYIAAADNKASEDVAAARLKYEGQPQQFAAWGKEYVQGLGQNAPDPEMKQAVQTLANRHVTETGNGIALRQNAREVASGKAAVTDQQTTLENEMTALALNGDTSSDSYKSRLEQWDSLQNARVANPLYGYSKDQAQYDRSQFLSKMTANAYVHGIDTVYKDQGVNPDGSAKGGAANALEAAKSILTDPNINLSEAERYNFYHKATGDVRANEAIRKQDLGEARAAATELSMRSATGANIDPSDVEQVAEAFRAAGSPAGASRIYATYARKPLGDAFGRQPLQDQTEQLNALRTAPGATTAAEARLIMHESGGNPTRVNSLGYAGLYQFGAPLLKDLGIYTPGAGENVTDKNAPGQWSGDKWTGSFNVPGFPEVKTLKDFLANPQAQKAAFDAHVTGMNAAIDSTGLDKSIGSTVNGVPITREGLQAMIHLGGVEGTQRVIASGGAVNPKDANGTSLLDYARVGANAAAPSPTASAWLIANRSTEVQKKARADWAMVMSDYEKSGIRPADSTINQIVNAARATNDAALLDGIAAGAERIEGGQRFAGTSLPEQHATLTQLETSGKEGLLSPGQAAWQKDFERINGAITKGIAENPISTTVQNFPEKFNVPGPLDMKNSQNFAAGLAVRGKIAQFAAQNWQTTTPSALDAADLKQVQAALDTPDPAVKGAIFQAISALPEDVRNATLAKIGEKRPDFMVAAAAGGLMRSAPDIAQSILRGQEAIKADKGYVPTKADATAFSEEMDKRLPAATFSLAGRTTDNGPYEVARGMIKARYADLSAQTGDTSGKVNNDRLQTATDDVTGGILHQNGGGFIAPRRGMSQGQFDNMMAGITDVDLGNAAVGSAGVKQSFRDVNEAADAVRSGAVQINSAAEVGGKTVRLVPGPQYKGDQSVPSVTTLNGQPVTADYLRHNAQLESIGDGRYQVRLGKDPLRPIYAYQGANTETPSKFVLDLRNRPVPTTVQPTGREVLSSMNLGGG